jgi:hypothetical protein
VKQTFNSATGLILVEAEISGPAARAGTTSVPDTGATITPLNPNILRSDGYEPDASNESVRMVTGATIEFVPRLMVARSSTRFRTTRSATLMRRSIPNQPLMFTNFLFRHRLIVARRAVGIALH